MSDPTTSVQGGSAPAQGTSGPQSTAPGGNAQAASKYTAATTVTSIQDLQTKAPELWHAMLMGIAQNIMGQMREAQQRLKEMMQKQRDGRG